MPCRSSLDCEQGQHCFGGTCRGPCSSDQQCAPGERCVGNYCLAATDAARPDAVEPEGGGRDGAAEDAAAARCGDGIVNTGTGEQCDDSGESPVCHANCRIKVTALDNSGSHTCALRGDSVIKCFGNNSSGELGVGHRASQGDEPDEMGAMLVRVGRDSAGDANLTAQHVSVGSTHSCAILQSDQVLCWGDNVYGKLGLGDSIDRGDDPGELVGWTVSLGSSLTATQIACGATHTCALLVSRQDRLVKCWGNNDFGKLGLGISGSASHVGDGPDEMGDLLPAVDLGPGDVVAVASGGNNTCAVLYDQSVHRLKCWGENGSGQLGIGDALSRGDDPGEMGTALPNVNLGTSGEVAAVDVGVGHVCALLADQHVKCWGENGSGELGLGDKGDRGDQQGEMGNNLPRVALGTGALVSKVTAGSNHTCALLTTGLVKCWGNNSYGQLGLGVSGATSHRGDDAGEMGSSLPAVDLGTGRSAVDVWAGVHDTCAQLDDGSIKCWGLNSYGRLGLGDTSDRGGAPGEMGDALPAVDIGAEP
ncbi:MAG: hypothetical protein JXR83_12510 [Deltaproteobacteria bacterium]|nr:hypothetical protein [Deltaproteobacteria bacterium]